MSKKKKAKPAQIGRSDIEMEDRRMRFVNAYLANGRNATQAAIEAGYATKGAHVTASRLIRNPKVMELIERQTKKVSEKVELRAETVMRSLVQTLTFDPRKLFHADGRMKGVLELDDDTAAALQSIEVVTSATGDEVLMTKKFRWESKNAARDQAHRILGNYLADNLQRGSGVRQMSDEELEAEIESEIDRRLAERGEGAGSRAPVGETTTARARTH